MRHERDMVRSVLGRSGWSPGLVFTDAELRRIETPTRLVFGSADPVGDVDLWRRVIGLMPRGDLALVEGAGHMPWFDEPTEVAALVDGFVAGADQAGRSRSTGPM
jgi:pimeloyl-ACP methyl ester carboxylesterase